MRMWSGRFEASRAGGTLASGVDAIERFRRVNPAQADSSQRVGRRARELSGGRRAVAFRLRGLLPLTRADARAAPRCPSAVTSARPLLSGVSHARHRRPRASACTLLPGNLSPSRALWLAATSFERRQSLLSQPNPSSLPPPRATSAPPSASASPLPSLALSSAWLLLGPCSLPLLVPCSTQAVHLSRPSSPRRQRAPACPQARHRSSTRRRACVQGLARPRCRRGASCARAGGAD